MDARCSRVCRSPWGGQWVVAAVILGLVGLAPPTATAQYWGAVTGTVTDADGGTALIGARVLLRSPETADVVRQTRTDAAGDFQFDRIRPGRYVVEAQLLGYKERRIPLRLEIGESRSLDVTLELKTESLETVVLSASRQRERLLEAPASVTVLGPEQLRREAATSSVEALRSVPGVDMAQTGVDRREVALRGFNGVFSTAPYVLADHREAGTPVLGLNTYSIMPTLGLDLRRVEVVRGPASALYGPGADGGVLHVVTTNPFREPGTAVSVAGGSRRYVEGQIRQAGVINGTVGYKVTAQVGRAHEWELDPEMPQDAPEIGRYRQYGPDEPIPAGRRTVDRQLRRQEDFRKYQANGLLRYRLGRETSLSLRGGYASLTSPLQTSIGTLQADGFAYSYSQLRLESRSFATQLTLNHNRADEDLYLLRTGTAPIDEGLRWDGQVTYRFGFAPFGTDVTLGSEATLTRRSAATGLAEGLDDVDEFGVYAHTTTPLASSLSLTLAARADHSSITDDVHVSPRAALVYTPSVHHALRVSYNRSFSPPAADGLFGTQFATGPMPALRTLTQTAELGYKGAVLENQLWLDVSGYYERKNNVFATRRVEPLTYEQAGPIEYWGIEASLEAYPTPVLTAFANVSYASDEHFPSADPDVALNAPGVKLRGGVEYGVPAGVSVGATAHYVASFPVRTGPYVGTVDSYTLLDVRAGAPVPSVPGLNVNVTARNVLGTDHREFVGAPELGRMVVARLIYDLPF